jgi:putative ABC transport system permease protein
MNGGNLRIYIRILFKNKVLSSINLFGLAVGIASCLFIMLYVVDELGYDSLHQNRDRIVRVTAEVKTDGSVDHIALSSSPLAKELKQNYPEVEEAARFNRAGNSTVMYRDHLYKEKDVYSADPEIFSIFSYRMLSGNPGQALVGSHRVVIAKRIAQKYFGEEEPIGKILTINKGDYEVTGIIDDLPFNSDLKFEILKTMDDASTADWLDISHYTYVLFRKNSTEAKNFQSVFENKLKGLSEEKYNKVFRADNQPAITVSLHIQPLKGLHFQQRLLYDTPKGDIKYITIFTITGLFILIVGCLNYINFSIVQSIKRSAEVGIRKVMGSGFWQLVGRYLGESVFMTFLAIGIAFAIVALLMPGFNEIAEKNFKLTDLLNGTILAAVAVVLLVVGILAGSYPAFYISSIKPVNALKGKVINPGGGGIRRISIMMQFIISIGLVFCTAITIRQMIFIRNHDLGFNQNNVVIINTPSDSVSSKKIMEFKESLGKKSGIENVAIGGVGALPGGEINRSSLWIVTDGKGETRMVNFAYVDEDYLPLLHIPLKQGRNYDAGRVNDFQNSAIINEAFVRMMGWKDPLQQKVKYAKEGPGMDRKVIGVIRDFNYISLYNKVQPLIVLYLEDKNTNLFVSFERNTQLSSQVSLLRNEWSKIFIDEPFVYHYLDESVAAQYRDEEKAMKVFTYFSILTIIISCLGLFGLSTLTVYQRKKEIGIRKIVGADFSSLLFLFSREYMALIFLSLVVVSPVCWLLMNRWLETFSYRAPISISLYVVIGVSVMGLSLLTILFSIFRISNSKPADLMIER